MKKTPLFVASAIGLTLAFYMAAYYLLPGDPPTGAIVGLFAAVVLALVWACNKLWLRKRAVKAPPPVGPAHIVVWAVTCLAGLLAHPAAVWAQQEATASAAATVRCTSERSRILPGDRMTITATAVSQRGRHLVYSYSASAGQITPSTAAPATATFSTMETEPGQIIVTCRVVDDEGLSASATTMVEVVDPASLYESAPIPQPSPLPVPPRSPHRHPRRSAVAALFQRSTG